MAVGAVVAVLLGIWALDLDRSGEGGQQIATATDGAVSDSAKLPAAPVDPSGGGGPTGEPGDGDEASAAAEAGSETDSGEIEDEAEAEGEAEGETEAESETDASPETGSSSPTIAKYKTAECQKVRSDAAKANKAWDWKGVLRLTKDRKCWVGNKSDRTRLEVQAYMELKRWDDCVRAGKGTAGEVKGWVNLCQSKM